MYGVSDLLRTCYEFLSAQIKNVAPRRIMEVYELRVEEYELRMLTYVRHTRDVPSKLATKAYNMHGWFDFNHFSWAGSNQNSLTVIRWSS